MTKGSGIVAGYEELQEAFKEIDETLRGKKGDRKDRGLLGDVEKNTDFRKSWEKFKWIWIVAITSGVVMMVFRLIERLNKQ